MAESFILFFFNDKILFAKPIVPKLRTVPSICVKSIHNPDNLYLSHPNSQLCGRVRGDHPTYKIRTSFVMPLAFSVSIFNKKSHRTRAVETKLQYFDIYLHNKNILEYA